MSLHGLSLFSNVISVSSIHSALASSFVLVVEIEQQVVEMSRGFQFSIIIKVTVRPRAGRPAYADRQMAG